MLEKYVSWSIINFLFEVVCSVKGDISWKSKVWKTTHVLQNAGSIAIHFSVNTLVYIMLYCIILCCCWIRILWCSGLLWHFSIRQIAMPTLYMLAILASSVLHLLSQGKDEWIVKSNRHREAFSIVMFLVPEVLERRRCYNHSLEGMPPSLLYISYATFFFSHLVLFNSLGVLVTGNLLTPCHLTVNALQQILLKWLMYVLCWCSACLFSTTWIPLYLWIYYISEDKIPIPSIFTFDTKKTCMSLWIVEWMFGQL